MPTTTTRERTLTDADVAAICDRLVPVIVHAVVAQLGAARRRPSPLSRADRDRLDRLVPAVAGALGSAAFIAADLFADDASAAVRLVVRGLNARRVGRLFQRAEGQDVAGYVVERAGVELHMVLWRIVQVVTGKGNVSVPPRRPAPAV